MFTLIANPMKYAPLICTLVSLVALVGILVGFVFSNALVAVVFLLPATVHEVYRTEGKFTKASSVLLLTVLLVEILL